MKSQSTNLTTLEVHTIVMKALDRHASNEYGETYEVACLRSDAARCEFDSLMSIIIETIDTVERLLSERIKTDG